MLATQNRSFFLVLVDNEITINEDMSVTIKANYRAYIEEAMDSNKFNALSTPELRNKMEEQKRKSGIKPPKLGKKETVMIEI